MSKRKKTQEEYVAELSIIHPNIEVIDTYLGGKYRIKHRCKECGYGSNGEWQPTPANLLSGHNCPICSPTNKKIGPAPDFRNSIWASEDREFFAKYMTETQLKLYTPRSRKKVTVICPDCGAEKIIAPMTLWSAGLGCNCSDGQSYPNKFIYAFLNQLAVEYSTEYSPTWAEHKRYDVYIPSVNCIIENHGMQHYSEQRGKFGRLADTQYNDKYKAQLAQNNGINNYVVLDCRYSSAKQIKASILNSELPSLLAFTEQDINWTGCAEYANKSIVRIVADLWNTGLTVNEICAAAAIGHTSALRYLDRANEIGLCNYSKEEASKRILAQDTYKGGGIPKRIYCFELDRFFDSLTEAANFIGGGTTRANISACCRGKNHHVKGYRFCYADKVNEYVFVKKKVSHRQVFCKETGIVYKSVKEAATENDVNHNTIRTRCEHSNHWSDKIKSSFYYLYDYESSNGLILGAITLGLITEKAALEQLTQISAL